MNNMLVLYRLTVTERQAQFEEHYKSYKSLQESIPGHLHEMLVRSTQDGTSYMIVSLWEEKSFYAWLQSPAHEMVVKMLNLYKKPETVVARYNVLSTFTQAQHAHIPA